MHIFDVQIFSGAAAVAQLGECQTEDLKAAGFSTEILILVQVPVEEKNRPCGQADAGKFFKHFPLRQ